MISLGKLRLIILKIILIVSVIVLVLVMINKFPM
jgi:hypothetical protein